MAGVAKLKTGRLSRLKSVALTTNGFLTDKVLSGTDNILRSLKEADLDLVVVLAMDGIGEIHDRIRKVKDGWKKLGATITGLIDLRQRHTNLIIGLKTTILPINVDELDSIARFAQERGLFTIISPCIITGGRYGNEDLRKGLAFTAGDVEKMIRFFESPAFQWSYHRRALLDLLGGRPVEKPCSAGFNYFFVRSTGDVHACPLIAEKLGNFKELPMSELLRSPAARRFRRGINSFEECRSCTEPGLERYALPFEGFHYLRLFRTLGRKDFLTFHTHMGLDKYF